MSFRTLSKRCMISAALGALSLPAAYSQSCHITILYNGKISTVNANDTTATSVVIEDDHILAVGSGRGVPRHQGCALLIDLKGRRVVPGLIDSHNHIVQVSLRPGHDVRLELATSIAEVEHQIHGKAATIAPGEWITASGGWSPPQFAEKRMPNLAELDAASIEHPVYVQTGFDGPAATNSKGKAFFEKRGIKVAVDGSIAANAPTVAAYNALESLRTPAEAERGALDVLTYAASVGLTTSDDKGGPWPVDTEGALGLADTSARTNSINPFTGYNQFLSLARAGKMPVRLRLFFYMQDTTIDLPFLRARLNNQFPDFGDDWLRVSGIGERITGGTFPFIPGKSPAVYETAARLVASRGWMYDEHAMGIEDEKAFTEIWEKINQEQPLAPLRWCLAHVPGIDAETLHRLQVLGVGVSAAGGRYLASNPPRTSAREIPPFRMLVESGIHVGYGGDGGTIAPLNPWLHMYYMVTGKNNAGQMVAPGQTLTRMQALRMYTASNAWFTKEENRLGSIEPGKLADLVVLNSDFLDEVAVPDEAIKKVTSVMTIVGGRVMHNTGELRVATGRAGQ